MAVITQMVVAVQLVIWMVMLSSCLMIEWRGRILPEFCRQAECGQGMTTTEESCFIFDIIKSDQYKMIQCVLRWAHHHALCSCFSLLTLGGISKLLFATIIEWSCNPIHHRLHKMVICTETKSDILQCLLGDIPVLHTFPETTATVLDDAVIVQLLSPKCGNATTFPDYAESVFIPHLSGFSRING